VLALCSVIKKQLMIPSLKRNYIPIRVITEVENKKKRNKAKRKYLAVQRKSILSLEM